MATEDSTVMDATSAQGVGDCLGTLPKDSQKVICSELIEGSVKVIDVERDDATVMASAAMLKRQNLKEEFTRSVINGQDVDVSFGNFPYFLR
jgi:hypothetical protein